jgi:hypothetical protein
VSTFGEFVSNSRGTEADAKSLQEFGVPLPEGSTTALPPTKEEIEKLQAVAPRYGIEIKLPKQ